MDVLYIKRESLPSTSSSRPKGVIPEYRICKSPILDSILCQSLPNLLVLGYSTLTGR